MDRQLAGKLKTVTNSSRTHGVMAGDAGSKAWRERGKAELPRYGTVWLPPIRVPLHSAATREKKEKEEK